LNPDRASDGPARLSARWAFSPGIQFGQALPVNQECIMKPADDPSSRARPARRGARTGRGPWLMLAVWIGAVAVLFLVGLLIRGM
jgi:hypothetical protein